MYRLQLTNQELDRLRKALRGHTPHLLEKLEKASLTPDDDEYWDEIDGFTVDEWKNEVNNDQTRLGYWEWIENRFYTQIDEEPPFHEPPVEDLEIGEPWF